MPIDKKTIDSYSRFASQWSTKLGSGHNLAQRFVEKPAMYALLEKVISAGDRVLCLGCGSGEECEYIRKTYHGRVTGIDLAEGMIVQASANYDTIDFRVMDIEKLDFPAACFDHAYASLSLYFFESLDGILDEVHRVLKPGGHLLFSLPHPLKWGSLKKDNKMEKTYKIGFTYNRSSGKHQVWGDYLNSRKITEKWFDREVSYMHHPLERTIGSVARSAFDLVGFAEPKVIDEAMGVNHAFWEIHQKIPLFALFMLRKT